MDHFRMHAAGAAYAESPDTRRICAGIWGHFKRLAERTGAYPLKLKLSLARFSVPNAEFRTHDTC